MAKSRNWFGLFIALILGCFFASLACGGISRGAIALAAQTVIASDVAGSPIVVSDEFTNQSKGETVIGGESSFLTTMATPPTGGSMTTSTEQSFKTLAGSLPPTEPFALSDESSFKTLALELPPVVPPGGGGGGGGGGGSSGGGRIQLPPPESPLPLAGCPVYLKKFIKFGANNDPEEVRKLQLFLRDYMELEVPVSGFYDEITFEAVKIFQLRYAKDILTPWGINYPTGYVYITTTLAINNLYCERNPANTLDLRSYFPAATSFSATTSPTIEPPTILPEVGVIKPEHSFWQMAAIGLLDFIRQNPYRWLALLLILILVILLTTNFNRRIEENGKEKDD